MAREDLSIPGPSNNWWTCQLLPRIPLRIILPADGTEAKRFAQRSFISHVDLFKNNLIRRMQKYRDDYAAARSNPVRILK
jgi:hypothetical protein